MPKLILVIPVKRDALLKALNTSKLVRKEIDVHRQGKTFRQTRWVKPGEEQKEQRKPAEKDPEDVRGSKQGYGMHRINVGDSVTFNVEGRPIKAKVIDDTHEEGVVVESGDGNKYNVRWRDITGFAGANQPPAQRDAGDGQPMAQVDPETFAAASWATQFDDPDATPEALLSELEKTLPGVQAEIQKTEARLKTLEQTIKNYRISGEGASAVYTVERQIQHESIIKHFLSPEKIAAATPAPGEKPVFIMLGGRGGSGKSWFKGKVYDESKSIVLDADEIKGMLGEYEGWNAAQVHEESSDILETVMVSARSAGLNVVLDATMKTTKSAMKKVDYFKEAGYSVEAHYMYCPRQEAAKRAVSRFMGKSKRYVPVDIVLSNTTNEATFDEVRKKADAWSFRSNYKNGKEGPTLISESGKKRFSDLVKSIYGFMRKGLYSKQKEGNVEKQERENAAIYDEYDNGPVTPDDKLSPFAKRMAAYVKKVKESRQAGKKPGPAKL